MGTNTLIPRSPPAPTGGFFFEANGAQKWQPLARPTERTVFRHHPWWRRRRVESCAQLGVPAEATWLIKWSDGKTSTFRFEATVNVSGGNFMITAPGTITDGRYKGNTAIATFTLLNSAGLFANGCDTPEGVTSISGPSSLVILND